MNPLKRLFSYTLSFKFSFFLSILGFILFASADIAAVEPPSDFDKVTTSGIILSYSNANNFPVLPNPH